MSIEWQDFVTFDLIGGR